MKNVLDQHTTPCVISYAHAIPSTLGKNDCLRIAGGQYGTGPGGVFSSSNFGAASRFAGGLGLLYGSFQVGWSIGSGLYRGYVNYKYR